MPVPADRRRSYLARQVGTLALAHLRADEAMAPVRAAAWHNTALSLGVPLPLFLAHDLGHLISGARDAERGGLAPPPGVVPALLLPQGGARLADGYREFLRLLAGAEVLERAHAWRLRDDVIAVLLVRLLGEVVSAAGVRARSLEAAELPLDPGIYAGADLGGHFADFDPAVTISVLEKLLERRWHVYTLLEQLDLGMLRLLALFREGRGAGVGLDVGGMDLADLFQALRSPEATSIVNFSLELLPSVLETKRAAGAQAFSVDGYASIEHCGSLDAIVPAEYALDDDVFARKLASGELSYYAHEKQREEERRLQYVLIDASASMRGARQVFARGLSLALAKKLALEGDEVWLRFFDSRLYDVVKLARGQPVNVPYLLSFRSERGRNYGKVFRSLVLELMRIKREGRRSVALYIVTHGQCHIPVELVLKLKKLAYLYGVIILPSGEVTLEALPHFDRVQIVGAGELGGAARREKALGILHGT